MKRQIGLFAAVLLVAMGVRAYGDYAATSGSGLTVFSFTCFTSKVCTTATLVNSAGAEAGVAALPLQVSLANTAANGTAVSVGQSTAASLNATVVGTGTFGVQATQAGTWTVQGTGAASAAVSGNPFRAGLSDGTNTQNWLTALALGDGVNGNNTGAVAPWLFNGTTWDRAPGTTKGAYGIIRDAAGNARGANVDASNRLSVSCDNGCSASTAITGWAGGTLGAMANFGTTPGAVLVPGVNASVIASALPSGAATSANQTTELASLASIDTKVGSAVPAGAALIGNVGIVNPAGSTPITATATGTTGATTATLAANATLHTYICGFSIRANATAAATGNATMTGVVTATMNFTQWTAPNASGLGIIEQVFSPCIISSATNTAIAVISAAPGTGGVVSVSAWGYQL